MMTDLEARKALVVTENSLEIESITRELISIYDFNRKQGYSIADSYQAAVTCLSYMPNEDLQLKNIFV